MCSAIVSGTSIAAPIPIVIVTKRERRDGRAACEAASNRAHRTAIATITMTSPILSDIPRSRASSPALTITATPVSEIEDARKLSRVSGSRKSTQLASPISSGPLDCISVALIAVVCCRLQ